MDLESPDGLTRTSDGMCELVGGMTHTTGDERHPWLNDRMCAVAGEVRSKADGGFDVVLEVAELVWEPVGAAVVVGGGRKGNGGTKRR